MGNELFDREAWEGVGETPFEEVQNLTKAIQAHEGVTDIADLSGGGALQVQSLETSLALLTWQEKHIKLYKDIGVQKAYSTLEEYSVQDGYGTEGGFVGQMENPEEDDADLRREYAVIKYIRTLWKASDVVQYTKTITNAELVQVQAAQLRALRIVERNLFFGDSDKIPQSFDGLERTIATKASTDHIFDMRGGNLTESNMKEAAELITANFGVPTKMYTSLGVQTAISNILGTSAQRLNQDQIKGTGAITLGHKVVEMATPFGNFTFEPDIFINPESQGVPKIKDPTTPSSLIEGATSTKAPAMPSLAIAVNAPTVAGSLWAASGSGGAIAGVYNYRVCAINQYGKSVACAQVSETVAASGALTLTITAGSGAYAATAFEIYRETAPSSGIIRYLTTVKSTGATTTYQDLNENLAGTSKAFLLDMTSVGDLRTMTLSQLAPMHKVNYAKIAPYKWGTVNFYVVPKWYAPLRMVMFKNIAVSKETTSPLIDL
jgi:hypothetical protein